MGRDAGAGREPIGRKEAAQAEVEIEWTRPGSSTSCAGVVRKDLVEVSMTTGVTLEDVVNLVKQLPLHDKVRLIEKVAPQIEQELRSIRPTPRRSLREYGGGSESPRKRSMRFVGKFEANFHG